MQGTRGVQRTTARLARRSAIVSAETLVVGIDIARRVSVVVSWPVAQSSISSRTTPARRRRAGLRSPEQFRFRCG
jgi:hypothetical protein